MKVSRFSGGSNSAGIPAAAFQMPDGLGIRYDRPAGALAEYVTGYAIYAASCAAPLIDCFLPAPAMISVLIDAGPVEVWVGSHHFGPVDQASLYGPTSRAFRTRTHGGIAVGIGISALGWSRMTRRSAGDFHNRVAPLENVLGREFGEALTMHLEAVSADEEMQPLLDRLLAPLFMVPHPREASVRMLSQLIVTDGIIETFDVAERLGVSVHELRRMAKRFFGMSPKLLLRRSRFLRSLIHATSPTGLVDYSLIDSSYFDVSHFLRDATTFLGDTPRRFFAADTTFLKASLRARAAVLGAPTQALQG